ncbi:TlpA family protein disulfide reductase [Sphingobacterium faecale]|uniref:TlpA family protein disulfide reductase n=1 Tax=Sphingobacterium faecale TaxID=2803775 RepID=A0ABS1R433_9SPHI|nr:TlpA disulfide reductase family protein [Sphingobacterium faecale]MBL1408999.1 TlpA family protein disulfide reductase [Sphingobacterium faecale]
MIAKLSAQSDEIIRDVVFEHTHKLFKPNRDTISIDLQQYRGKFIVFDFWNRFCSSCIQQMPKLYELQLDYSDDIVIIPVTKDDLNQVAGAFAKQLGGPYEFRLPSIYGDTILNNLFGVIANPDVVWLDRNGEFLVKTSGEALNKEVLDLVLKGDISFLNRVARVSKMHFYERIGLHNVIESGERRDSVFLSIKMTPYAKALSSNILTYKKQVNRKNEKLVYINKTLYEMVQSIYDEEKDPATIKWIDDDRNRFIIRSEKVSARFKDRDSLRRIRDFAERTAFREKQLFCLFAAGHDSISQKELKHAALQVLESSLDVKTGIRPQKMRCFRIEALSDRAERGKEQNQFIPPEQRKSISSISELVKYFNNTYTNSPILTAKGDAVLKEPLNMILDKRMTADEAIDYLKNTGFKIEVGYELIDVLTID